MAEAGGRSIAILGRQLIQALTACYAVLGRNFDPAAMVCCHKQEVLDNYAPQNAMFTTSFSNLDFPIL